jgi:acetyltransferase-like isoleucine patch superfamily enzyme
LNLSEILNRIDFWKKVDRIGPDVPWTHWRLHFKSTMQALCKKKFMHFAEGADFRPGAYAVGCSRISLGKRVVIRPGCMLHANPDMVEASITIEDDVMIGSGVHIYLDKHRFDDPYVPIINQGDFPPKPVVLKRGCWVGANSIILPGVSVGENSVIGAGSVVTRSVPARVLVAGNPAKIIRAFKLENEHDT